MPDSIQEVFLIQGDQELRALNSAAYPSEADLQTLLENHPQLLAGGLIDREHPRRWLLIQREQAVPDSDTSKGRWAIDHLFVDQDGVPTLVEVKRASDTRARREVVAQMLDYAANGVRFWSIEMLRESFETHCIQADHDPQELLSKLLGDDEVDQDAFWRRVQTNLSAGRIRLIFVADVIAPELARIVEFLNEQMQQTDVFALELPQYIDQDLRLIVPRLLGQTAKAEATKSVGGQSTEDLTETDWWERYQTENGEQSLKNAKCLESFLVSKGLRAEITKGSQHERRYRLNVYGKDISVFSITRLGRFFFNFGFLDQWSPFDQKEYWTLLMDQLQAMAAVNFGNTKDGKYPRIELAPLSERDCDQVTELCAQIIGHLKHGMLAE